ncbi:hypothetical protein SELMODRAFT_424257 [Selaginella moellendorffii]|uniref:Uncharacterized protein n=1 Tax=Selaginella moellendorffii TaxID=88036 RepID=D8SPB1_SELML|nr:hypothetical protein SELMODRAFT_424257 [Selaginella moellendorffii]
MASSWDSFLDFKDKDSARAALELGWRSGPACATALAFIRNRISQVESHPSSELEELREIERGVVECYKMEAVDLSKEDWDRYFEQRLSIYGCDPAEYPRPLAWGPLMAVKLRVLSYVESMRLFCVEFILSTGTQLHLFIKKIEEMDKYHLETGLVEEMTRTRVQEYSRISEVEW